MLCLALGRSYGSGFSTLRSVQNIGQVAAINCTFASVYKCRSILPEGRSLVLLLGNTLGNELNEVETLRHIAAFMRPGDLLLVEVQLLEEKPPDLSQLTKRFQASKFFYAAPFVVVGYDENDIELTVDSDTFPGLLSDAFASTLLVRCLLREGRVINHPGISTPIEVPPNKSIGVQLIRKYKPDFVRPVFDAAGLKVNAQAESEARQGSRKFLYILAEK